MNTLPLYIALGLVAFAVALPAFVKLFTLFELPDDRPSGGPWGKE